MSGKLLVVDDDPGAMEVVARLYARAGYEVHRAESMSDAMFQIVSADPGFSGVLCLLGNSAPDESVRLVEGVRTHADPAIAGTRLVAVSYPGKPHVDLWAAGVDGFIYRPPHEHDLMHVMADVLARPNDQRAAYRAHELEMARASAGPTAGPTAH
jgi:DNA-binding response OmpR family regulator